jgi:hypothetical protein
LGGTLGIHELTAWAARTKNAEQNQPKCTGAENKNPTEKSNAKNEDSIFPARKDETSRQDPKGKIIRSRTTAQQRQTAQIHWEKLTAQHKM